jgi:folate-binding Fe-S cluster repair protein YgfZ
MMPISAPAMLLDFTHRAKFKVTGNDWVRFLNGQLTNDIVSLRNGSAIGACALTVGLCWCWTISGKTT